MHSFYLLFQINRLAQAVLLLTSIQEISGLDPAGMALLRCFFGVFHNPAISSGDSPLHRIAFTVIESFDIRRLIGSQRQTLKHRQSSAYYILRSFSPILLAFFCAVFSYFFPFFRRFPF